MQGQPRRIRLAGIHQWDNEKLPWGGGASRHLLTYRDISGLADPSARTNASWKGDLPEQWRFEGGPPSLPIRIETLVLGGPFAQVGSANGNAQMHWHVFYRVGGVDRELWMESRDIPHIKAVAFTIFVHEFSMEPSPCEAGADVESWLSVKGVSILDVQLDSPR